MKKVGRNILRGKPLDDNCKKTNISTHEYGMKDNRVFCYGLIDCMTDDFLPKCVECGAFVDNATPFEEVSK